jgi:NitT/TauT family transport system substrate-binding protein
MYKVTNGCIGCNACVSIAPNNFSMNGKYATCNKQPESDIEKEQCNKAMNSCPTSAIDLENNKPIFSSSNVKETIELYPILKDKLIELSPKFKTMQNPVMWNTIAKFASFKDASKMTGISICEILHFVNKLIGTEKELFEQFPECVKEVSNILISKSPVDDSSEYVFTIENIEDLTKLIHELDNLRASLDIYVTNQMSIEPIKAYANEKGLILEEFTGKSYTKLRIKKNDIETIDVRTMNTDPFDILIKKAYSLKNGESFRLIQRFIPQPFINMLTELSFSHRVEYEKPLEVSIIFTKDETSSDTKDLMSEKPSLIIQSATPVAYPIIMKLLSSKELNKAINIKELKVWEETEKHLGWIMNEKADISFSAVITASKLTSANVKMPYVIVWDNFSLITTKDAKSFSQLKGENIYMPLFDEAPPAKITKYIIEAGGLNIDDYNFIYGDPFGRPEEMLKGLISGKITSALLREPEASYAIEGLKRNGLNYNKISYSEIWNSINPGFGLVPNAGVIVKESLLKDYPKEMEVFEKELENAINWVNSNKIESSKQSYDIMRQSIDNVNAFLENVTFQMTKGDKLVDKVNSYFKILTQNNVINVDSEYVSNKMFKIE